MSRQLDVDAYEEHVWSVGEQLNLRKLTNRAVKTARATRRMSHVYSEVWELNPTQCDIVAWGPMAVHLESAIESFISRDNRIDTCRATKIDHITLHSNACRLTVKVEVTVRTVRDMRSRKV